MATTPVKTETPVKNSTEFKSAHQRFAIILQHMDLARSAWRWCKR